jgi:hypothetical protein
MSDTTTTTTDCLHCAINDLVRERMEGQTADLAELASMVAESLADLILLAPKDEQGKLVADALAHFGSMFLEKGNEMEAGASSSTH